MSTCKIWVGAGKMHRKILKGEKNMKHIKTEVDEVYSCSDVVVLAVTKYYQHPDLGEIYTNGNIQIDVERLSVSCSHACESVHAGIFYSNDHHKCVDNQLDFDLIDEYQLSDTEIESLDEFKDIERKLSKAQAKLKLLSLAVDEYCDLYREQARLFKKVEDLGLELSDSTVAAYQHYLAEWQDQQNKVLNLGLLEDDLEYLESSEHRYRILEYVERCYAGKFLEAVSGWSL